MTQINLGGTELTNAAAATEPSSLVTLAQLDAAAAGTDLEGGSAVTGMAPAGAYDGGSSTSGAPTATFDGGAA